MVGVGRYRDGVEVDAQRCAAIYTADHITAECVPVLASMIADADTRHSDFVWLAVASPTRAELDRLGEAFGISALWIEDAMNPAQRAKFEVAADNRSGLVVFKIVEYLKASSEVRMGQLSIMIGHSYVLTVRWGPEGRLLAVRRGLVARPDFLKMGPLAVLQGVADAIVDDYLEVSDDIHADVDRIEEIVFSPVITDDSEAIYRLKRENLEIRRAVAPLVPLAHTLVKRQVPDVADGLQSYLHDVGDHLLRVNDAVEAHDSLLFTMLSASNSRQSLQQNIDMRKIASYAAILAFPTAIAGIYGMNFDYMPELHSAWGYPSALAVMAIGMGVIFRAFKRSGWL